MRARAPGTRLQQVDVGRRSLRSYRRVAPHWTLELLAQQAAPLRGVRVLHLNATPYGGGVSELLRAAVPLLNDLGLEVEWRVINGDQEFFTVTKALHNALQGSPRALSEDERQAYLATSERNAALIGGGYDVVFVHDPQPVALLSLVERGRTSWVWRCHIDTSSPNPAVWDFLRPFVAEYDACVFTMRQFVLPNLPVARVEIVPPAIDPLSPKNIDLDEATACDVLDWIGIDLDRPLVTQVSRFDPWKDPFGVIAAYRLVRERVPELQLALVGSMALDDPEAWEVYRQLEEESAADPLIHVFTNLTGVGNVEVNAFQRLSDVILQKSLREGFGLVVSEAMWKRTPVVAGNAGGIPLQMADGAGGYLVGTVEEAAQALLRLLADPDLADDQARRGHERVHEHFLLPRLLLSELSLIAELVGARGLPRLRRDPVCGLPLRPRRGREEGFCSERCRRLAEAGALAGEGPGGGEPGQARAL